MIVRAGKSEVCRQIARLEPREELVLQPSVQRQILSSSGDLSLLSRFPAHWMRPEHIMEVDLFYSKSADLGVNHILKYLHNNI